jgi:hypothetical protein
MGETAPVFWYSFPSRSPNQPDLRKRKEMKKDKLEQYTVTARLINTYEIKVMATDEYAALKSLDEWVAEDFTDYITNQQWDMEAI